MISAYPGSQLTGLQTRHAGLAVTQNPFTRPLLSAGLTGWGWCVVKEFDELYTLEPNNQVSARAHQPRTPGPEKELLALRELPACRPLKCGLASRSPVYLGSGPSWSKLLPLTLEMFCTKVGHKTHR